MLVPKCIRYFEETVPQLDEEQYMRHFRISRELTEHLADRFAQSHYFHYQEGVIGVVDGSHIRIDKPNNDPESYFNRKKFHSIQVQIY
nr:unnamed protein product [Callosobruchus analis]